MFRVVSNAWFAMGAGLMELLGVTIVVEYGEGWTALGASAAASPNEDRVKQLLERDLPGVVLVANHFCRLDWLFTWPLELRHGWGMSKVIALKAGLRHVPGVGWAMQSMRYLFIERDWRRDRAKISSIAKSVTRDGPISLLIFPEGTDISAHRLGQSQAFARERGLQLFEHVLHPRTKGVTHIVGALRQLGALRAVWDVTIGYHGFPPGGGEAEFFSGAWPRQIHFHIARFPSAELPEAPDAVAGWVKQRWERKEELMAGFKASCATGLPRFPGCSGAPSPFPRRHFASAFAPAFIYFVTWVIPRWLMSSGWAQLLLCVGSAFFVAAGLCGGVQRYLIGTE